MNKYLVVIAVILSSCSVTNKSKSKSSESIAIHTNDTTDSTHSATVDSTSVKSSDSSYTRKKTVSITFENDYAGSAVKSDSVPSKEDFYYSIGGKEIKSSRPIKSIDITDVSTGKSTKLDITSLHKKDTTAVEKKKSTDVKIESKKESKDVKKFRVSGWQIIILVVVALLFYFWIWPMIAPLFKKRKDPINRHTQF
jgi:hypothetical protein